MKRYLITGSNGLLGQKLIYALLEKNNVEIVAASRGENRLRVTSGYVYEDLDITDFDQVNKVMKWYKPDCIINTAAMTNVDACETEKELCWKINVNGTENLVTALQQAQQAKPLYKPHFIHLSTDFIFDGLNGPYKETDEPNPLSYYAKSKLESEKIVIKCNLKWAIARTIIVYGIVENMSRSNIVLWAKDALEKGQNIKVVDDQFRCPTLAEDLADGCIKIAEKGATGIYHLSGKDFMSVLELVYKVADHFKLDKNLITPIKSDSLNQAAKRPPITGFVIDKAVNDLGYNPHSFEEGLEIVERQLS